MIPFGTSRPPSHCLGAPAFTTNQHETCGRIRLVTRTCEASAALTFPRHFVSILTRSRFSMQSSFFKAIAWVVVCAAVVLLAVTTGSAVAHELQHAAHHNAGMHGSGICAWMCATAGVHVVTPLHQTQTFDVVSHVPVRSDPACLTPLLTQSQPRAPPHSA